MTARRKVQMPETRIFTGAGERCLQDADADAADGPARTRPARNQTQLEH